MSSRFPVLLASAAVSALALVGCSTPAGVTEPEADGVVQVVASTNVYGDIASRIGGELVEVTSIITRPAQDPHSYEASARDQLALSKADLVIENGGGYDPFIGRMLEGTGADAVVLTASEASGPLGGDADHTDGAHEHIKGSNEHVWYSFPAVEEIAHEIADELGQIDEANAATYEANHESFAVELNALHDRAHGMEALTEGKTAAITEPVPVYLLQDVGLGNATPDEFSEAIEEGTDVPPAVLRETLDLVSSGDVALLAYNEQTAGAEAVQVREAAEEAGVPVVSLVETLPNGVTYLEWMSANLDAIEAALTNGS